jgi:hypothetical protein
MGGGEGGDAARGIQQGEAATKRKGCSGSEAEGRGVSAGRAAAAQLDWMR